MAWPKYYFASHKAALNSKVNLIRLNLLCQTRGT